MFDAVQCLCTLCLRPDVLDDFVEVSLFGVELALQVRLLCLWVDIEKGKRRGSGTYQ